MRKRILILPAAAPTIVALCVYRIATIDHNVPPPIPPSGNHLPVREQEMFELSDENNNSIRLKAFLGRHQIVLAFFDAKTGPKDNPTIELLRRNFDKVASTNTKIFAISPAIPQVSRKFMQESGPYPFPFLTDLLGTVQENWGVAEKTASHTPGLTFFIDRAGNVDHGKESPRPIDDPEAFIARLIAN